MGAGGTVADPYDAFVSDLMEALAEEPVEGLDLAALQAALEAARVPCLEPVFDGTEAAVGLGRVGGRPDLPPGYDWPRHAGQPMVFLFQVDLDALPEHELVRAHLPDHGVLSFFYDAFGEPWDGEDGLAVLHLSKAGLVRTDPPEDIDDAWEEVVERDGPLGWVAGHTLPGLNHPGWPLKELADAHMELEDVLHDIASDHGMHFGNFGLFTPGAPLQPCDPTARIARQVDEAPADWVLLAEIGGSFYIADDGTLYVGVRRADLAEGRFERARLLVVSG